MEIYYTYSNYVIIIGILGMSKPHHQHHLSLLRVTHFRSLFGSILGALRMFSTRMFPAGSTESNISFEFECHIQIVCLWVPYLSNMRIRM